MSTKNTKAKSTKQPAKGEPANEVKEPTETKLDAKHGIAVTKAIEQGLALANKSFGADVLTQSLGKAISSVNPHLKVTDTGITPAKGYKPDELELSKIISGLLRTNDETQKFKTCLQWVIGDAAILTESLGEGGSDRVVAQAISERGMAKHTAMQAIAVCRDFAPEDRISGVSFTHHQELRNYRKSIKNKKGYAKLVEELREQAKADEVMSCAELRQRLQILAGKVDEEKPKKDKKDKGEKDDGAHKFLYIDEDGNVTKSHGCRLDMVKSGKFICIDVDDDTVLNEHGAIYYSISDAEYKPTVDVESSPAEAPAEPEAPPAKADKPKGKAKGKASIPD